MIKMIKILNEVVRICFLLQYISKNMNSYIQNPIISMISILDLKHEKISI